jgi:hypothetical protein
MSEQPAGQPNASPQPQADVYDPPIEHDPIGQALIGLPFALATGVGEAAVEAGSVVGEVGKEVISWGAAELGIGAAESLTEGSQGDDGAGGAGGGAGGPADPGAGDQSEPADAGAGDQSGAPEPATCDDPGASADMPADMPVDMPAE